MIHSHDLIKNRILIIGASGMLGQRLINFYSNLKDIELLAASFEEKYYEENISYRQIDISKRESIKKVVYDFYPDVIINAAAFTNVDLCEKEKEIAWKINVKGVEYLADFARILDAHLIHVSTDYVFDGKNGPYSERDIPKPISYYGRTKLASENVKVVLGGDGGDELFGGYHRYYGNIYASYYALIPQAIRKNVFGKMLDILPDGNWYQSLSHKLKWIHQISFYNQGERYSKSLSYFYFSNGIFDRIFTDNFRNQVEAFDPEASVKEYYNSSNAKELIDKMLYSDSMIRMPDHPVMVLDRMTMAHSLESRSPFLDHKLAEFCASIPTEFKIKGSKRRYIQVELAKRYLPHQIIDRRKQGFASPITYLLDNEFRMLYKTYLHNSRLVEDNYLERNVIEKLLNEHLEKKADHGQRLWLLFNSEIWYRMFIDGVSKDTFHQQLLEVA